MGEMIDQPDGKFRLTWNLPAKKQWFFPDSDHVRINIRDGHIMFRAASRGGKDAVTVLDRTRGGAEGGKEAFVAGNNADELLERLKAMGWSQKQPFFMLERCPLNRDWFSISSHHEGDNAPPKFLPHLRLWLPREQPRRAPDATVDGEVLKMFGPLANKLIEARSIVADFESDRRIGRPTREIKRAQSTLAAFASFVHQVLPNFGGGVPIRAVEEAHRALGRALAQVATLDGTLSLDGVAAAEAIPVTGSWNMPTDADEVVTAPAAAPAKRNAAPTMGMPVARASSAKSGVSAGKAETGKLRAAKTGGAKTTGMKTGIKTGKRKIAAKGQVATAQPRHGTVAAAPAVEPVVKPAAAARPQVAKAALPAVKVTRGSAKAKGKAAMKAKPVRASAKLVARRAEPVQTDMELTPPVQAVQSEPAKQPAVAQAEVAQAEVILAEAVTTSPQIEDNVFESLEQSAPAYDATHPQAAEEVQAALTKHDVAENLVQAAPARGKSKAAGGSATSKRQAAQREQDVAADAANEMAGVKELTVEPDPEYVLQDPNAEVPKWNGASGRKSGGWKGQGKRVDGHG